MPQGYGQQLLHTERQSQSPVVQQIKEDTAQIINDLFEQKEQTTNPDVKRWISKSIVYLESAVYYAEQALNVSAIQQQEFSNGGQMQQKRQFRQQREQAMS